MLKQTQKTKKEKVKSHDLLPIATKSEAKHHRRLFTVSMFWIKLVFIAAYQLMHINAMMHFWCCPWHQSKQKKTAVT